jgi:hypothetical protein
MTIMHDDAEEFNNEFKMTTNPRLEYVDIPSVDPNIHITRYRELMLDGEIIIYEHRTFRNENGNLHLETRYIYW